MKRTVHCDDYVNCACVLFIVSDEGRQPPDPSELVVTASSPIIISEEGREAVAGVVGLQMRYDKFYELFMNSTKICHSKKNESCNMTCDSPVSILYHPKY